MEEASEGEMWSLPWEGLSRQAVTRETQKRQKRGKEILSFACWNLQRDGLIKRSINKWMSFLEHTSNTPPYSEDFARRVNQKHLCKETLANSQSQKNFFLGHTVVHEDLNQPA